MFKKTTKLLMGSIALVALAVTLTACGGSVEYDSSKPVGSQIDHSITGIDAGAGVMVSTKRAIDTYSNLKDNHWQLKPTSSAAMTSTLGKAIKKKQPIVVTGWTPHWMFKKYSLKYLKDPKNVYGKSESLNTIARKGLKQDNPGAYQLLKNFKWNQDLMGDVMVAVNDGAKPEEAAKTFLKKHPDQVKEWLKGVSNGNGKEVKLSYVAWDSEIASTNVVAQLLKMKGYKVSAQAMEMQPMWVSVSSGSTDASTAAWLPVTAGSYYKQYKNKIDLVQTSLEGAKVGLVVPTYMKNINSIEDLNK